jgi:hypothetical protein
VLDLVTDQIGTSQFENYPKTLMPLAVIKFKSCMKEKNEYGEDAEGWGPYFSQASLPAELPTG